MALSQDQRGELLARIADLQRETNSVTVQIGHVDDNNQVKHDSVTIENAPSRIVSKLIEDGYSISIDDRGARVWDLR